MMRYRGQAGELGQGLGAGSADPLGRLEDPGRLPTGLRPFLSFALQPVAWTEQDQFCPALLLGLRNQRAEFA
ncbi:MAG: hypothetical protein ACRBM6_31125 [Geminicoccales bacterium]